MLVGYGVFRGLLKVLPRGRRRSVTVASFVAALLSVPAAACCFTGIFALGGTADVALGKVFTAMVGVHVLIGIGEAFITAATVGAVMAVRPDLVHGARGLTRPLRLRTVTPRRPARRRARRTSTGSRRPPSARTPRTAARRPSRGRAPGGPPGRPRGRCGSVVWPPRPCAPAWSASTPPPARTA